MPLQKYTSSQQFLPGRDAGQAWTELTMCRKRRPPPTNPVQRGLGHLLQLPAARVHHQVDLTNTKYVKTTNYRIQIPLTCSQTPQGISPPQNPRRQRDQIPKKPRQGLVLSAWTAVKLSQVDINNIQSREGKKLSFSIQS